MTKAQKILALSLGFMLLAPLPVMAKTRNTKVKHLPPTKATLTLKNLKTVYNSAINAQARYLAFAAQARREGYFRAAKLFRALAKSEGLLAARYAKTAKAMGHKVVAGIGKPKVGGTKENMLAAVNKLTYEVQITYPEFIAQAQEDKNEKAAESFERAKAVKANHNKLLAGAASDLDGWKAGGDVFICRECGHVAAKLDFQSCPVCNAPVSEFEKAK